MEGGGIGIWVIETGFIRIKSFIPCTKNSIMDLSKIIHRNTELHYLRKNISFRKQIFDRLHEFNFILNIQSILFFFFFFLARQVRVMSLGGDFIHHSQSISD